MIKRFSAVLLISAFASVAVAQTMYKCGNTYSQQPCGDDAKPIAMQGVSQPVVTPPVDPVKTANMIEQCKAALVSSPLWKDRDSVIIRSVERGRASRNDMGGRYVMTVGYSAIVNGKNSYGAYAGEKVMVCLANADETAIIGVI